MADQADPMATQPAPDKHDVGNGAAPPAAEGTTMSDAGRSGDKDRRSKERDRPRGDSRHGDRRARDDKGERSSSRRDRRERSRSRDRQRSRRSA